MIIKLIDRQMIRGYFKSYFVCLASLLSLYVVVDLFTNLDDFTHHNGLWASLLRIFTYYAYKVAQIFDRLCEAIVLLAAMFTVAWMQRNNEQVPLLSAGVSTRVHRSAGAVVGVFYARSHRPQPGVHHSASPTSWRWIATIRAARSGCRCDPRMIRAASTSPGTRQNVNA